MKGNYILGDGMSGLIAKHYLPDYTIISKPLVDKPWFSLGPRYPYCSKPMEKLLDELGLPTSRRLVRVGYYKNGEFVQPTKRDIRSYVVKTRMGFMGKGVMSMGKKRFHVYDVPVDVVEKKLRKGVRVRRDVVTNISERFVVGERRDYNYNNLIVTIPRPVFDYMCGYRDVNYKWNSVLFEWCRAWAHPMWDTEFDYVYVLGEDPVYRITKMEYPYVVEEKVDNTRTLRGPTEYWLEFGKVCNDFCEPVSPPGPSRVQFLGRFAEWKDWVKVHDVVRRCQKWKT